MPDYTFDWCNVWIVGNGPSSASILPHIPEGASVLCLNDALYRVLNLDKAHRVAVFSLDRHWVYRNKNILASFCGEKHIALPLGTFPECADIPGVEYYGWSHIEGLSDDPHVIATGQNSGYGAINLCYLKGAKSIHLVGYDMDPAHDKNFKYWAPFFRHALPQLRARGIVVLNHNPDSFVDAFPKVGRPVMIDGVERPMGIQHDESMIFDYAPPGHPGARGLSRSI